MCKKSAPNYLFGKNILLGIIILGFFGIFYCHNRIKKRYIKIGFWRINNGFNMIGAIRDF
jgi:hypothetical protein